MGVALKSNDFKALTLVLPGGQRRPSGTGGAQELSLRTIKTMKCLRLQL